MFSGTHPHWLRPSILQKGLGLILVPLLIQVVCCWQFYNLLAKTEELTAIETKQSLLVEQLNKQMELFTIGWGTLLAETMESTKIGAMDAETFKQKTDEGFVKLKALSPSENFRGIIAEVEVMAKKQYDLLKEFTDTDPDESSAAVFAKIRRMKLVLRPYIKRNVYINGALAEERNKLNETKKLAAENRESTKVQLFIGVAVDIIVTLGLLIFFLKNITDRLALLVRNARLLPGGNPLPAKVSGSDELAYLDEVLHQASGELEKAAEYRQSMMETMSHDLRSPIQSALIIAEVLESLPLAKESEKTGQRISSLKRNLSRVVKLVEDHLTFDKLESGTAQLEISKFDMRALVDEAIDGVAAQATVKSIELANKVESIEVEADRGRILQVLANFLTNAVKFSPASAPIFISSQNLGHSVKILILDDGPGMSNEAQTRIYERFQQDTNNVRAGEGFGLGLAICKLLITYHGGTVGVTSTPGAGSTFWFVLPLKYLP